MSGVVPSWHRLMEKELTASQSKKTGSLVQPDRRLATGERVFCILIAYCQLEQSA